VRRPLALAVAAVALAASPAAPAFADQDTGVGHGIAPPNNRELTAAAVCLQDVPVVPVLGDRRIACAVGGLLDHGLG
jgi:hypothetical protein